MLQQFYPVPEHNYLYELNKDMNFAAAHAIPDERAGVCANVHGHTYFVNITIVGNELDELGFLVNFSVLKKLIHGRYDHGVMNGFKEFQPGTMGGGPTTENVAREIFDKVQDYLASQSNNPICLQVLVRETPTSYVIYRG